MMGLDSLPWYRRDPLAFLEKTKALEMDECGVYARLMDLMYVHGRAMPDDWGTTGMAVFGLHATKNKAKVWKRIRQRLLDGGFIYVDADGNLAQKRVVEELNWQRSQREKKAAAGKASGEARQSKKGGSDRTSVQQDASNAPTTNEQTVSSGDKSLKNKGEGGTDVPPVFDRVERLDSTSVAKAPDVTSPVANAPGDAATGCNRKAAIDAYNVVAKRVGWRLCCEASKLSETRRRKLDAHLRKRGGIAGWMRDLAAIEGERWTHGDAQRKRGHESWKFSLDDMFQTNFRSRMDDFAASGDQHANENDPLTEERWACTKRREIGKWPGGFDASKISAQVQAEFADLFQGMSR